MSGLVADNGASGWCRDGRRDEVTQRNRCEKAIDDGGRRDIGD